MDSTKGEIMPKIRSHSFVSSWRLTMGRVLASVFLTGVMVSQAASAVEDASAHWWAVKPVERPEVPLRAGDEWSQNPIDRFVDRALQKADLTPSPKADRRELIRRVYFDLIGLPPSADAVEQFANDTNPKAWSNLVEELLNSPHYGERWGQHWLDVTRWAESDGYRQDAFRPHAWPYRDYVVNSFNQDKRYDQFVREQLAGDEIAPDNPDVMIGTAYLRNGIYEYNQRNVEMHWELIVDELTSLTGEVFMGVGIGCAQCHDHKFDPIPQEDYYRLKAMLAPVSWKFDVPLATPKQKREHERQLQVWLEATKDLREQIDAIVEPQIKARQHAALIMFPEAIQAIFAMPKEQRTPYQQQLMDLANIQVEYERERFDETKSIKGEESEKLKQLRAALKAYDYLKPASLTPAFVASDVGRNAPKVLLKNRAGARDIDPGFLSVLEPASLPIQSPAHGNTTGRRSTLAEWLTDEKHPLTPRVIVNRIWLKHFKDGLVASPNDFGELGKAPSHPELLDWLASEFLASGWSFKHMHRLIVHSSTYQQTARREPGARESETDPINRLLWRYPPQRLDAAQVRDAMLTVSGELDRSLGGPSVKGDRQRRSIYVRKIRNTPDEILKGFDSPTGFNSTPVRDATTTPGQALLLMNGDWILKRAQQFAELLRSTHGDDVVAMVREACQRCYGRHAGEAETHMAVTFLQDNRAEGDSLVDMCQMLLSSNEFLYLH
jgi:hypothetical protein